jgi:hypothetical protein
MGNCVLKECGFHLNNQQQLKEKLFKERIKHEYFFKMADEFDSVKEKSTGKPLFIIHKPSEESEKPSKNVDLSSARENREITEESHEKHETKQKKSKFIRTPDFKLHGEKDENEFFKRTNSGEKSDAVLNSPIFDKTEEKSLKNDKINGKNEKTKKAKSKSGQKTEDLRKSGVSSDYKSGFQNKLFTNDLSSDSEHGGGEDFEQIFKDEQESDDDEGYLEKLFPGTRNGKN